MSPNPQQFNFFDGDKIRTEWVSDSIKAFANLMQERRLSGTQLRAFYNEFLRIRDITADTNEKNILIKLLAAKVSYRRTAKGTDIPEEFVTFVSTLVDQIEDSDSRFKQACYIMEALVGFYPKK
ncbi:MAG TPA: type III-A CRISPR-associated protein Csm2 [Candidatus Cloacimonadota bacterium]|nr:type III-A CRISPR-associated protein Csm2 [Candidatus Cloacimonadota bacterium]